jgi:hypothetical protein
VWIAHVVGLLKPFEGVLSNLIALEDRLSKAEHGLGRTIRFRHSLQRPDIKVRKAIPMPEKDVVEQTAREQQSSRIIVLRSVHSEVSKVYDS